MLIHILISSLALSAVSPTDLRPLLNAMQWVESRNDPNAVGDRGLSRGPYQIQWAYWAEGCRAGGVAWSYDKHVRDVDRCKYVIYHYWQRHCPAAVAARDMRTLARVHNGGPNGHIRKSTLAYWSRIVRCLTTKNKKVSLTRTSIAASTATAPARAASSAGAAAAARKNTARQGKPRRPAASAPAAASTR